MKRLPAAAVKLALLLLLPSIVEAAVAQRVVSTAPGFTETLFAIGAGERVVAVSTYCHYPAAVEKLPRVGTYLSPNLEAIAKLRPDLVLMHSEQQQLVNQLRGMGIRTLALRNTSLEDTIQSIEEIGKATGAEAKASELVRGIRQRLAALRQNAGAKAGRSIVFVIGRTPGRLDGMLAVGRGSFLNELIQAAGGRNILGDSPVTYPRISLEAVMRLDPDVIVDMGDMAVTTEATERHLAAVRELWQTQSRLKAVREKRVFAVASDIFVVPGPRLVEAAEELARMLYGANGAGKR